MKSAEPKVDPQEGERIVHYKYRSLAQGKRVYMHPSVPLSSALTDAGDWLIVHVVKRDGTWYRIPAKGAIPK